PRGGPVLSPSSVAFVRRRRCCRQVFERNPRHHCPNLGKSNSAFRIAKRILTIAPLIKESPTLSQYWLEFPPCDEYRQYARHRKTTMTTKAVRKALNEGMPKNRSLAICCLLRLVISTLSDWHR